jgi:hypothetical protein
MVYRGNAIYRILFIVSLLIALALVVSSLYLNFVTQATTLIISVFFFILAFSYFNLSVQENKG